MTTRTTRIRGIPASSASGPRACNHLWTTHASCNIAIIVLLLVVVQPLPCHGWTQTVSSTMPATSVNRSTQNRHPYCTYSHPHHKGSVGCSSSRSHSRSRTQLYDSPEPDWFTSSEQQRPWTLSPSDLDRLSNLRSRQKTLPLLIGQDSLLPGQTLELTSTDAKFQRMCQTLDVDDEVALVGMHPYRPGEPLTVGVTVTVEQKTILRVASSLSSASSLDSSSGSQILLKVKAKEVVDVQGQPWWDEKRSCFITNLEVAQDDFDDGTIMSASRTSASTPPSNAASILSMKKSRHYQQAKVWFDELPALLEQWWNTMDHAPSGRNSNNNNNHLSPQVIATIATEMDFTNRALAVAALLNPSSPPSWTHHQHQRQQSSSKFRVTNNKNNNSSNSMNPAVALEIRPALLACRNHYDRVHLVHAALQALLRQHFTGGDDDNHKSSN